VAFYFLNVIIVKFVHRNGNYTRVKLNKLCHHRYVRCADPTAICLNFTRRQQWRGKALGGPGSTVIVRGPQLPGSKLEWRRMEGFGEGQSPPYQLGHLYIKGQQNVVVTMVLILSICPININLYHSLYLHSYHFITYIVKVRIIKRHEVMNN